jgi:hypothetical protein
MIALAVTDETAKHVSRKQWKINRPGAEMGNLSSCFPHRQKNGKSLCFQKGRNEPLVP